MQYHQDPVLNYIITKAQSVDWIHSLLLFGSRARGDNHERSDYDIAVKTNENMNSTDSQWTLWALDLCDNVPTFCGLDLVKIDESMSQELKQVIEKEGIIIYEHPTSL